MIADGKRGDISVSAAAYAQALIGGMQTPFGAVAGLGADMVTVNPLMGGDAVEPFVTAARAAGAGVLVLVRTSNPGAADVEDLELAGGGAFGSGWRGSSTSWAGRAWARRAQRRGRGRRRHRPRPSRASPRADAACRRSCCPGVGAQGGRVEDLAPAFAPGRAGGLVTRLAQHRGRVHGRRGEDPRDGCAAPRPSACARRAWGARGQTGSLASGCALHGITGVRRLGMLGERQR